MDNNSLAHSKWNCKYHIVFAPKLSVANFMRFLKVKRSLMIFDRHANLKYKYGKRNFWCRGYYLDTVGRNKKVIEEYIKNQLMENMIEDQISMKEYMDPFTGELAKDLRMYRRHKSYRI